MGNDFCFYLYVSSHKATSVYHCSPCVTAVIKQCTDWTYRPRLHLASDSQCAPSQYGSRWRKTGRTGSVTVNRQKTGRSATGHTNSQKFKTKIYGFSWAVFITIFSAVYHTFVSCFWQNKLFYMNCFIFYVTIALVSEEEIVVVFLFWFHFVKKAVQ